MTQPRDPRRRRSEPDERLRALGAFGPLAPRAGALVLLGLGFLPAGLGVVGAGVAYDLTGSAWSLPAGLLAGIGVGLAFARDLARWRFGPLSLLLCAAFLAIFGLSRWLD